MQFQMNRPPDLQARGTRGQRGSTMIQATIVLAVIGILSGFAIVSFSSTRANLRLQNSTRQLAGYMERARLDAIRRHATSTVIFTDVNT